MEELLNILPRSEKEAISRAELSERLGVRDRFVRELIREARREGYVVQTAEKGYWLDDSEEGWKALQSKLMSRAVDLIQTANALKNRKAEGQEVL